MSARAGAAAPGTGHQAEPDPQTERSVLGTAADMTNTHHYPVEATCRKCGERAIIRSPRDDWQHKDEYLAVSAS